MTKFVKILALALGLGLLATGLITITGRPTAAVGAAPVDIVAVSVASVPVSGTVNMGNMPGVNVANTPTVKFAAGSSVNVTNALDASSNPTPLATLDAFQPYEDNCVGNFGGLVDASCNFLAVLSGKRLVIQEVDAEVTVETGLKPTNVKLSPNGTFGISHQFTATFMGTVTFSTPFPDHFSTHQETRLYAAQNVTPVCDVSLTHSSNGGFTCQLSGFLVDVP